MEQQLAHHAQRPVVPHEHQRASTSVSARGALRSLVEMNGCIRTAPATCLPGTRQPNLLEERAQRAPLRTLLQHASNGQLGGLASRLGRTHGRGDGSGGSGGSMRCVGSLALGLGVGRAWESRPWERGRRQGLEQARLRALQRVDSVPRQDEGVLGTVEQPVGPL